MSSKCFNQERIFYFLCDQVSEVNMGTDKSNFDFANYSRIKYITGSLLDVTQGPSSKEIPGTICVCNKNIYKR